MYIRTKGNGGPEVPPGGSAACQGREEAHDVPILEDLLRLRVQAVDQADTGYLVRDAKALDQGAQGGSVRELEGDTLRLPATPAR